MFLYVNHTYVYMYIFVFEYLCGVKLLKECKPLEMSVC